MQYPYYRITVTEITEPKGGDRYENKEEVFDQRVQYVSLAELVRLLNPTDLNPISNE